MSNSGLDDTQRRRRRGLVVTLAAAGALIAAVLLAPDYQDITPPRLATARPSASAADTLPQAPRLHDQEFSRHTAAEASLAASDMAYGWIRECLVERDFAARKFKYWPNCGLSDRNVDNVQLRKQLVTRLARAGAFGAIEDVHQEGPNGRFGAFADDPKSHARLLEEAHEVGLAMGEPCVLTGEAVKLQSKGDLWRLVGASETARAEYLRALAYSVAGVAGLAKQTGVPFGGREDPKVQEEVREYQGRLAPQDRDIAIAEGQRIAQGWQPLLTSRERVEGRVPTGAGTRPAEKLHPSDR